MRPVLLLVVAALLAGGCATAEGAWQRLPSAPDQRSEVAAARAGTRIVVAGGLTADGRPSARVDAYDIRRRAWKRLRDLPQPVDHAMAASRGDVVYVIGGYRGSGPDRRASADAYALEDGRWRALARMPGPRAAGGAAIVRNTLYAVAGVAGPGGGQLLERSFALDLRTGRWRSIAGPTPREHLGVAALGGLVYALGGRTAGLTTNLSTAEVYDPRLRRWSRLPEMPSARGGTAAGSAGGVVVSVGGEGENGRTFRQAEAFDPATRRWRSLAANPLPRHGLGVVGAGRRIYAVMGGPVPGLSVSGTLLSLRVRG
jgi:N-acetylneuraminic acid mutarotase